MPETDSGRLEHLDVFFQALFAPGDCITLAQSTVDGVMRHDQCQLRNIRPELQQRIATPNNYFLASAMEESRNYNEVNCIRSHAFYIDLDIRDAIHSDGKFASSEDALGYLATMPVRPDLIWETGHGMQAAFLLDAPFDFSTDDDIEFYKEVGRDLCRFGLSDGVFSPCHLFRVPFTINSKKHKDLPVPDARGRRLWIVSNLPGCGNAGPRRNLEALENALLDYGIENILEEQAVMREEFNGKDSDRDGERKDIEYHELPKHIRGIIEKKKKGSINRSTEMFKAVRKLYRHGCSDKSIHDAIAEGPNFREKYESRLRREVDRIIGKHEKRPDPMATRNLGMPIVASNKPKEIDLEDCEALPETVREKLERHMDAIGAGVDRRNELRDWARFSEHLFQSGGQGVIDAPCGAGKTVWAICHVAANGGADSPYLYVAETVDALYRVAESIGNLMGDSAKELLGRVHGHNEAKCMELRGSDEKYDWRQCSRNPEATSKCRDCCANGECRHYNRIGEDRKPVRITTHENFRRMLEENSSLKGVNVIVDEGLDSFSNCEFRLSDLKLVQRAVGPAGNPELEGLEGLFPHSLLSHPHLLPGKPGDPIPETYASVNYVFQDMTRTADLKPILDALRKALRPDGILSSPGGLDPAKCEHARDIIMDLLSFFRPSAAEDACYAFRELRIDPDKAGDRPEQKVKYAAKRIRFDLGSGYEWNRMWMLDASVQLSPTEYPDAMPVYRRKDAETGSGRVRLHAVRGNPTAKHLEDNIEAAGYLLRFGVLGKHRKIFAATGKREKQLDGVRDLIKQVLGKRTDPNVLHGTRGRIKGSNGFGECTLAFLAGMPLFTTIDDYALYAAMELRRTFPAKPHVFQENGKPRMPGGRFRIDEMQRYFALKSLDEIYQAVYRTAVRNGGIVEAVIVVPDAWWLIALWRTVMPEFSMGSGLRKMSENEMEAERRRLEDLSAELRATMEAGGHTEAEIGKTMDEHGFERQLECLENGPAYGIDRDIEGLKIVNSQPGDAFAKSDIAGQFGYFKGDRNREGEKVKESPWKRAKERIWPMLGSFFKDDPGNNRKLIRK